MDELRDFLRSRGKITLTLVVVNILLFFVMDFRGNTENGGYMLAHGAAYGPLILENGSITGCLRPCFCTLASSISLEIC